MVGVVHGGHWWSRSMGGQLIIFQYVNEPKGYHGGPWLGWSMVRGGLWGSPWWSMMRVGLWWVVHGRRE